MNLLGSFDRFVAICDDAGIIISLFILFISVFPDSQYIFEIFFAAAPRFIGESGNLSYSLSLFYGLWRIFTDDEQYLCSNYYRRYHQIYKKMQNFYYAKKGN